MGYTLAFQQPGRPQTGYREANAPPSARQPLSGVANDEKDNDYMRSLTFHTAGQTTTQ